MVSIKKNIWIFPFVGGIFSIISFLTPAAHFYYQYPSYSTKFYRWMLDFYVSNVYYENGVQTTTIGLNISLTGYISITSSILIIISSILIIISANKFRKRIPYSNIDWLTLALLTVSLTILWMVMKETSTRISFNHSFWGLLSPAFGIIGPFIGSGLEIIGFILIRKT